MQIKKGDIIRVAPQWKYVKVDDILKESDDIKREIEQLKYYWSLKYDMELPEYFNIAKCHFKSSEQYLYPKQYNYPVYKKCVKRPIFQKKALKKFNLGR